METTSPVVETAGPVNQAVNEQDKLFDFNEARIHLNRMVKDWEEEVAETVKRRKVRKVKVDVESLRRTGQLDEDETLIPVRVIDTNIQREVPTYINYIKNSRRICTFRALEVPNFDTQLIEQAFTQGMTYTKWEIPHFKVVDGAMTHGWDAVEVVYDESKPLNVSIEHIGHDNLIFPRSCVDFQQSPRVIRKYEVSFIQLQKWVKTFGFDAEQVETLIKQIRDTSKEVETLTIYKLYFKKDGVVFCGWFSLQHGVSDWLKKPYQHYVGIQEQQMTLMSGPDGMPVQQPQMVDQSVSLYPIFLLNYRETEEAQQIEHEGRVFLDEHKQEGQTAVMSGFVNGITRASNIYASPATEDGSGESLKEISNIKLVGGRVLSKPMNFFNTDYPDPMVIRAMQYFDTANSQETNQPNFAAINREDSRKTATEMNAAENAKTEINSVQLTNYSTFIRETYSFAWPIVQSQASQNKIVFLTIEQQKPVINPVTQQPVIDPMSGQPQMETSYVNNIQVISLKYELRAAGDVDVVKRQEMEMKMQQDWPVVSSTPLASRFLSDYIRLRYPDQGEQYAMMLQQMDQMQQLQAMVGRLSTVMQGMIEQHPEMMQELPPGDQQALNQMLQESQSATQQAGNGSMGQPAQQQG